MIWTTRRSHPLLVNHHLFYSRYPNNHTIGTGSCNRCKLLFTTPSSSSSSLLLLSTVVSKQRHDTTTFSLLHYYRNNNVLVPKFMFGIIVTATTAAVLVFGGVGETRTTFLVDAFTPSIRTTTATPIRSSSKQLLFQSSSNNNNNNPSISNWIGNIASNLMNRNSESSSTLLVGSEDLLTRIDTWDTIRQKWSDTCSNDNERNFRNLVEQGRIASPLNKIRLFGNDNEQDIRVTFYRDSASWCPYCQKVWIALEQKGISYKVEKINMNCYGDKPLSFRQLQPSGQIPVAIIDGTTYRQSNDILQILDTNFPNTTPLVPPTIDEDRLSYLLRLERSIFSSWLQWLTGGSGKDRFLQTLDVVEQALKESSGSFFIGNTISIVDIQFAPFLERMTASLLYYKGFQIRYPPGVATGSKKYPNINAWFDAMEQLPSYRLTKSDYYTHCWDLPPQLGGCIMEPSGKQYAAVINGEARLNNNNNNNVGGGSWEIPLDIHNGGIEPDWGWAVPTAKRDAVERVSANYQAIINFAARGAGSRGFPPVSAPLADPNAQPSNDPNVKHSISLCFQIICSKLLNDNNNDQYDKTMQDIAKIIKEQNIQDDVINSLTYVRDRIGVPRDMSLPAARQLRAHLNWSIGILLQDS